MSVWQMEYSVYKNYKTIIKLRSIRHSSQGLSIIEDIPQQWFNPEIFELNIGQITDNFVERGVLKLGENVY